MGPSSCDTILVNIYWGIWCAKLCWVLRIQRWVRDCSSPQKAQNLKKKTPECETYGSEDLWLCCSLMLSSWLQQFLAQSRYSTRIYIFFFAEEDSPWANICANLPLFCIWVATTAWPPTSGVGLHPGTEPGLLKQSVPNLTTRPQGWPPANIFWVTILPDNFNFCSLWEQNSRLFSHADLYSWWHSALCVWWFLIVR